MGDSVSPKVFLGTPRPFLFFYVPYNFLLLSLSRVPLLKNNTFQY